MTTTHDSADKDNVLNRTQKALAHELMNAGYEDAAEYMLGVYMGHVMAENIRPTPIAQPDTRADVEALKMECLIELKGPIEDNYSENCFEADVISFAIDHPAGNTARRSGGGEGVDCGGSRNP